MATIGEFVEYLKTLPQDTKVRIVVLEDRHCRSSYTDLDINKDIEGKLRPSDCFYDDGRGVLYIGEI